MTVSEESRARIVGTHVVAAMSGGKDSTAMSLWLTEQGVEHSRVFADTGWEAPETYAYLDALRARLGPIDVVRNEKLWADARPGEAGMLTLIRRKQMFPSRTRRFCTEQLKLVPLKAHLLRLADDQPVINAVGIRAAESRARSTMIEWEWNDDFDCWVWRPLIAWSEQDVIDIHTRHGLAPNPLYLRGSARVGCYPCIYARKAEIATLPESVVERLAPLERELTADAVARGVDRPERAFFRILDPLSGTEGFLPIERVRDWARTDLYVHGFSTRLAGGVDGWTWGIIEHPEMTFEIGRPPEPLSRERAVIEAWVSGFQKLVLLAATLD